MPRAIAGQQQQREALEPGAAAAAAALTGGHSLLAAGAYAAAPHRSLLTDASNVGTGSCEATIPSTAAIVGGVVGGLTLLSLCLIGALFVAVANIHGWQFMGRRIGGNGSSDDKDVGSGTDRELNDGMRPIASIVASRLEAVPSGSGPVADAALSADDLIATSLTAASAATSLNLDASWKDCLIEPEQIQILRRHDGSPWCLGGGAYGTVYKALYDGVQVVAAKVLTGLGDAAMLEAFTREALILRGLRDRNIVQFVGVCPGRAGEGHEDQAMMIQEFVEAGDMMKALRWRDQEGRRVYGFYNRGRKAAADIARGLHYLHSRRIIHLDIKSNNVLLARDGTAKIADVGLACTLSKTYITDPGTMGTFAWSAPEVLTGQPCSFSADIYSYGIVLWEICTGEVPSRGRMRDVVVPDECPQAASDIIDECLNMDPALRPTAKQLVQRLQLLASAPTFRSHTTQGGGAKRPDASKGPSRKPPPQKAATILSGISEGEALEAVSQHQKNGPAGAPGIDSAQDSQWHRQAQPAEGGAGPGAAVPGTSSGPVRSPFRTVSFDRTGVPDFGNGPFASPFNSASR